MAVITRGKPEEKQVTIKGTNIIIPKVSLGTPENFDLTTKRLGQETDWKVLLVGPPGSGKTFVFYKLVRKKRKVLLISHELGRGGSRTIYNNLRKEGEEVLRECGDYLEEIRSSSLEHTFMIFNNLNRVKISTGQPLWEWGPDVIGLEGFNFIQDEIIAAALAGTAEVDLLTKFNDNFKKPEINDWTAINRGTRNYAKLLLNDTVNPLTNKSPHIIMSLYIKKEEKVDLKTRVRTTIYEDLALQGMMKSQLAGGFDVVIQTIAQESNDGSEFYYKIWKERGLDVKANKKKTVKADFDKVLEMLETNLEIGNLEAVDLDTLVNNNQPVEEIKAEPKDE